MEGEDQTLDLRLVVVLGMVLITGLVVHLFIVTVNAVDWLNGRPISVADRIITSLGISRVIFQAACIVNVILIIFYQESSVFLVIKTSINFLELSSNYCSIWLSTLLSLAFCLKVLCFHHDLFLHLKTMVSQRVKSFIIFCGMVSVIHTSFITWLNFVTDLKHSHFDNETDPSYAIEKAEHYVYYFTFGNSIPFLIHLTSSVLLIAFLCLHLNKIQYGNNVTAQLGPVYIGIKFMTVSFLSFAVQVVISITILYYDYLLGFLSSYMIWTGFPCVHSIYLICRTVKLKNYLLNIWHCGNHGLVNRHDS